MTALPARLRDQPWVVVVDDDVQLSVMIAFGLRRAGYAVEVVHDGRAAIAALADRPDLLLLDVNLPDMNGFEVLRRVRAASDTPVILLTVRGDDDDVVRGLDLGADDYVTKPFSPETLLARIRAVLRRSGALAGDDLEVSGLRLDLDRHEVGVAGEAPERLTPLEYRLLHCLMVNAPGVLTHEALIEHVWGYGPAGDRVLLKQLVRRLRLKIETDPARPQHLIAVPGVGYTLGKTGAAKATR